MSLLRMMILVLKKPSDFFYDLQFERRSRIDHALYIVAMVIVVRILSLTYTGFPFQTRESFEVSVIIEAVLILTFWLSWVISNWGLSVILDGEGKFKDVLVGTAYTFVPFIFISMILLLVSQVISLSENAIYSFLSTGMFLWVVLLLYIKIRELHDFEGLKTVLIFILTILGMLVLWFVFFLISGLIVQAVQFVIDLYNEIRFRL